MSERSDGPAFRSSGFFALRSPLLAFDELVLWGEGVEAVRSGIAGEHLATAALADRARLTARLRKLWERDAVREAVYLGSPSLSSALRAWTVGTPDDRTSDVVSSLVAYLTRMAARPTPFGLFAGVSVGVVGGDTRLEIGPQSAYRRHTRLDMDYLDALASALEKDPAIRDILVWRPNSSLYGAAGRLRYAEARVEGVLRSYHLVALDRTEYLDATLERARVGASIDRLAAALVDGEIDETEARGFVHELIDNQVLVSNLVPNVTGDEPIHGMIEALRGGEAGASVVGHLERVRDSLARIDAGGLGASPGGYRSVQDMLEELPVKAEPSRLFQVDMVKPSSAVLGADVLDEIVRAVEILHRLAPRPAAEPLARFREAFVERYGDREVPLTEALDEEIGVGFESTTPSGESPLLEGIRLPPQSPEEGRADPPRGPLLRKLAEALEAGSQEIVLAEEDLVAMASGEPRQLPDALEVLAAIAAPSDDAIDGGAFRVLIHGVGGAPGVRLLGRFCHADAVLLDAVKAHLRAEEARRPEAIFAEVVHLPEGRVGNILLRPVLRGHEIPYLGRSGALTDAQIGVEDLLVSVAQDTVRLRSRRLGREVVPQLTTAHAFEDRALSLYQFLCALQSQGVAEGLGWSWGALESAPFLPRVSTGRIVLSRAAWNLDRAEMARLDLGEPAERFRAVQAWRSERRLPRWVVLVDGDRELAVDLDNVLSVDAFLHHVKGRPVARVVELFPGPDELCASGPEGRFVHQLVVPLLRVGQPSAVPSPSRAPVSIRRSFPPGSEWLYAKLYAGASVADRVLVDLIGPVVDEAVAEGLVDGWFFIRYGDPRWHLRVRFHGDPSALSRHVLPLLHDAASPFLEAGLLWRLQLDTYEREAERYGGDEAMLQSEELFRSDSEAVLAILATLSGDEGLDARWRLTLAGIDRLLGDLGFDLATKLAWAARVRDGFAREHRIDGGVRAQLGKTYRIHGRELQELLRIGGTDVAEHPLGPGLAALDRRSAAVAPLCMTLRDLERSGRLPTTIEDLAASYSHMHANRLLRSAHRLQELVMYDLLERIYRSQMVRSGG